MKTFIRHEFFEDGQHGWLKVSKSRLKQLGILSEISGFSYMRKGHVFLEEDVDLSLYVEALLKIEKVERETPEYLIFMQELWGLIDTRCSEKRSKIRGYEHFKDLTESEVKEIAEIRSKLLNLRHWGKTSIRQINNAPQSRLMFWKEHYKI